MKYFKKLLNAAISVVVFLILAFSSCDASGPADPIPGYGSVRLIVPAGWDPDIVSVQVIGQGPSGRGFDLSFPVSASPISISNVLAGPWTFFVFALNGASEKVLAGQASAVIEDGATTEISVTLSPLIGTGTLVVEFRWPVGILSNPVVSASLAQYIDGDVFGLPADLVPFSYSESGGTALYRYEGVHDAGYYLLETHVDDDDGAPWAHSDAVLITSGNVTPVTIDLETGSVEIQIILSPSDPLDVTLTPDTASRLPAGTDMTVAGAVTGGTPPYTYRWYLDGELMAGETGTFVVIGSALSAGRYRLTLIASDGGVLGSDGMVFDIMP